MIPPCLILSNIRYALRVKWSNPGKGLAPSLTPQCSSYWKGSLLVALDYDRQLFLLTFYIFLSFPVLRLFLLILFYFIFGWSSCDNCCSYCCSFAISYCMLRKDRVRKKKQTDSTLFYRVMSEDRRWYLKLKINFTCLLL